MSSEWFAFVDESGNDGIDFDQKNVSDYYVLAGVVVRSSALSGGRGVFERTKATYFRNAPEMKSDNVGGDDDRRLRVTASLAAAPFDLHLRVTEKKLLRGPGFRYAKSFVKYLLGDLVSQLLDRYDAPVIICDRMKTPSFEKEVKEYLYARHPRVLMRQWSFDFCDSKDEVCVQAADVIAGTGHRCCQRLPLAPEQDQLLHLFNKHLSTGSFHRFPRPVPDESAGASEVLTGRYDPELEMKAVSDAEAYVSQHMSPREPLKAVLVECIREMLKHNSLQPSLYWVPTRRLVAVCEEVLEEQVSPRRVRSFIGKLRDEGLLIASRRNPGGYKLPDRMADVVEFLNTQNEKIRPMMRRIQKARNVVYGLSRKDILVDAGFRNLLRLLPVVGTPADNI